MSKLFVLSLFGIVCCSEACSVSDVDVSDHSDPDGTESTDNGPFFTVGTDSSDSADADDTAAHDPARQALCNLALLWRVPLDALGSVRRVHPISDKTRLVFEHDDGAFFEIDEAGEQTLIFNGSDHGVSGHDIEMSAWGDGFLVSRRTTDDRHLFDVYAADGTRKSSGEVPLHSDWDVPRLELYFRPDAATLFATWWEINLEESALVDFGLMAYDGTMLWKKAVDPETIFSTRGELTEDGAAWLYRNRKGIGAIDLESGAERWFSAIAELETVDASRDGQDVLIETKGEGLVVLKDGELAGTVQPASSIWNISMAPDGRYSAYTTMEAATLLLDGQPLFSAKTAIDYMATLDVSSEGTMAIGCGRENNGQGEVVLVDAEGQCIGLIPTPRDTSGYHPSVRFIGDEHHFYVSSKDGLSLYRIVDDDPTCVPQVISVQWP